MEKKLLIIDALTPYHYFVKRVLVNDGYFVKLLDMEERIFQAIEEYDPDLILLDVQMNKGQGFSILKTIKLGIKREEPVIIISGGKNISEIEKSFKYGAYDYLIKPLNLRDLKNKIRKSFEKDRINKIKYNDY